MIKTDTIDKSSWEKAKYNDPYEIKDDVSTSEEQDANLFSTFNLPKMCLSSVIDMYKNKNSFGNNDSGNKSENIERFSTAKKLFESSALECVEVPKPAARNHIYKNLELKDTSSTQLSPNKIKTENKYCNDDSDPGNHFNKHPAHCHDEDLDGIYYEQPWDLSNTQGQIQLFLNKALPVSQKNSKNAAPTSHNADFRTQGKYEKPWDLNPEKKDDRGQEGYDQAWDLKPHNKDERPCGDYDLPWDKNARQIERKFRASQKGIERISSKKNNKHNIVSENIDRKSISVFAQNIDSKEQKTGNVAAYMNIEIKKGRCTKKVAQEKVDGRLMSSSCLGIGTQAQEEYYNIQKLVHQKNADDDNISSKSRSLISLNNETPSCNYVNQQMIEKIQQKHPPPPLQPKTPSKSDKNGAKIAEKKFEKKSEKKSEKKDKKSEKKSHKESKLQSKDDKKHAKTPATFRIPSPPSQPPQLVRSTRQDDPRSGDEYDVPWDQKIKNLLARAKSEVNAKPDRQPEVSKLNAGMKKAIHTTSSNAVTFDIKAPLESQCWYHGLISRTQAEELLRSLREGSYLVRTSESNQSDYSLSVKSSKGFMHMKIVACKTPNKSTQYILGQFSQPFQSIPQMVHHYSQSKLPIKGAEHISLLYPVSQDFL